MGKRARHGNDWRKRVEDRRKSLAQRFGRIKNIVSRDKRPKDVVESEKSFLSQFEEQIEQQYKDCLHEQTFLIETKNGSIETRKPASKYEDLAALFLQAREHAGLYIVLSWPESFDWPYFSQLLANKTITSDSQYEDGLKVSFYPSTSRRIGKGRGIRIDKDELIHEAREAAQNNCLCARHNAYFALNDFESDEKNCIRHNPSIVENTPFFGLSEDLTWDLIGGGYFKDIYTYMFNFTGNKRRSAIGHLASQLNDPQKTKEGAFLIGPSVSSKDAVVSSVDPVKTDLLFVDGCSKALASLHRGSDFVKSVVAQWINSGHSNSLIVAVDNPKIYKRYIFEAVELYKKNKSSFEKSPIKRFSFFNLDTELTVKTDSDEDVYSRPDKYPELVVIGKQSYNKFARLYTIAKKTDEYDRNLCRQMYRAIGFLDRLITLPISQAELRDWIRELTENWTESDTFTLAKKYLWKSYKREWIRTNDQSGAIASKDEFIKVCDEIVEGSNDVNEVSELLINQLIDGMEGGNHRTLLLVRERRISEFVRDMISDLITSDDDLAVDVAVYSSEVDANSYDDVFVLGFRERDLKDILFELPKGRTGTTVYVSTSTAFKIENELDVILELDSFNSIHPDIQEMKNQIAPLLDSIRHMGMPTEFSIDKSYGNSYDYDYAYASYANIYLSNKLVIDVGKDTTILKCAQGEYYAVTVENIEEGDWILPLDGFIEDIENELGKPLPRTGDDSELLKSYFQMAKNNLKSGFECNTRTEKAHNVFEKMEQIDPELCTQIHEGMINRWIKHIEEFSNEDELSSNSAKKKEHFMLFARAIGITDELSNIFWEDGIKATRVNHIQAGKGISNALKHIILNTMTGSELDLCDAEVAKIMSMADERLSRVELVLPSEGSDTGQ